jgi:hypothetical protein
VCNSFARPTMGRWLRSGEAYDDAVKAYGVSPLSLLLQMKGCSVTSHYSDFFVPSCVRVTVLFCSDDCVFLNVEKGGTLLAHTYTY